MDALPLVSIILVSWNSARFLPRCLEHLSKQTFQGFEIVLIDNGSQDRGTDHIESEYPQLRLRVERLDSNIGFAAANNRGARLARGKWIALLNTDAFPEPDWLEQLLQAARSHPGGSFFSSRQVQADQPALLDGSGDEYHVSGLAWRRFYNYQASRYGHNTEEVFGACAAAALYEREAFLHVEGFDEEFFSYFEDVDLSFRLRLAGGRCLYVPQAVVHHIGSASSGKTSPFAIYHAHRNMIWTFFKNMPGLLVWVCLPFHIAINALFVFSFLLKGRGTAILRGKLDAVRGMSRVLQKRRQIQRSRTASTWQIWRAMNRDVLAPYRVVRQPRKEME